MSRIDFMKLERKAKPTRHTWWAVDGKRIRKLDVLVVDGHASFKLAGSAGRTYRPLNGSVRVFESKLEATVELDPGRRVKRWLVDAFDMKIIPFQMSPSGVLYSETGRRAGYDSDRLFKTLRGARRQLIEIMTKWAGDTSAELKRVRGQIRALEEKT